RWVVTEETYLQSCVWTGADIHGGELLDGDLAAVESHARRAHIPINGDGNVDPPVVRKWLVPWNRLEVGCLGREAGAVTFDEQREKEGRFARPKAHVREGEIVALTPIGGRDPDVEVDRARPHAVEDLLKRRSRRLRVILREPRSGRVSGLEGERR